MLLSTSNPYDIFSPLSQRNHLLYEQMRSEDPVHCAIHPETAQRYWFLTRYDDCLSFLKDKRFGKDPRRRLESQSANHLLETDAEDIINQHMLNLDEPAHTRLKSLVHLAFMPQTINSLRPRLQEIADRLFDAIETEILDGDEFDLTDKYINKFPLMAIAEMLGIPIADFAALFTWTQNMLSSNEKIVHHSIAEFSAYLSHEIGKRRSKPQQFDDILASLIVAEHAGDKLSRQELLAMVYLLITAGYETMVNFISNGIVTLFENPDQMQLLQANIDDSSILKSAIEEILRYAGPSHMTLASWAFEDVPMRGKIIQRGDIVHAVLHAANRDPLVFREPDKFDILRQPNKHIAFSYGIHHCLGAALARLEAEIALVTLLRRMPNL